MTYPPQPGQWGPSAPPPGPPQPPPGYYPPQGWNPQQPPPQKGGGLKWLLIAVAVLLVIAISVGVTLFVTRNGSGGNGSTATASPGANDIASADDTAPVSIVISDPTCTGWRSIQGNLSAAAAGPWGDRDPALTKPQWTAAQKSEYEAVGRAMRSTADQTVNLAKSTPHRVMRELYEQFTAYGRAYADSIPNYQPEDDALSRVSVSIANTVTAICDAIDYGDIAVRSESVPAAKAPSRAPVLGNVNEPTRYLTDASSGCDGLTKAYSNFKTGVADWTHLDSAIPAGSWTSEQRDAQDRAAQAMSTYAAELNGLAGDVGGVFEDFAYLAALYFEAYALATPTYKPSDSNISSAAVGLSGVLTASCKAASV